MSRLMTTDSIHTSPSDHTEAALVARVKRLVKDGRAPSVGAVSKRLFNDWHRVDDLASGESFLRPPTMREAMRILAEIEADPPWLRPRKRRARKANGA